MKSMTSYNKYINNTSARYLQLSPTINEANCLISNNAAAILKQKTSIAVQALNVSMQSNTVFIPCKSRGNIHSINDITNTNKGAPIPKEK